MSYPMTEKEKIDHDQETEKKLSQKETKEISEKEVDFSASELLQLKKDFAKEYFEKLQKDQGFSLSWLLLSEAWIIEEYLTTEQHFLDTIKDNVVKEFILKKALTEDVISQLESVKTDIDSISQTNKEDIKKELEKLRIKYNIKKEVPWSDANIHLNNTEISPSVAAVWVVSAVPAAVEIQKESPYWSPFLNEKTGKPRKFRISSLFGKRIHPVTWEEHVHTGIDIAEEEWTPIQSMCDWVVTKNKKTLLGWREIYIKDATGKEFCYLHLSEKSPLAKWTIVKAGQEIGKVGNTWRSTWPHLHLTVKDHNKHVDPVKTFPDIFEKHVA